MSDSRSSTTAKNLPSLGTQRVKKQQRRNREAVAFATLEAIRSRYQYQSGDSRCSFSLQPLIHQLLQLVLSLNFRLYHIGPHGTAVLVVSSTSGNFGTVGVRMRVSNSHGNPVAQKRHNSTSAAPHRTALHRQFLVCAVEEILLLPKRTKKVPLRQQQNPIFPPRYQAALTHRPGGTNTRRESLQQTSLATVNIVPSPTSHLPILFAHTNSDSLPDVLLLQWHFGQKSKKRRGDEQ